MSNSETVSFLTRTTSAAPPSQPMPANGIAGGVDPLLTAREAAAYRRQGRSTFWRDVRDGRVPPAIYVAPKSPRWRLSDLCPARTTGELSATAALGKRRSNHQK